MIQENALSREKICGLEWHLGKRNWYFVGDIDADRNVEERKKI